LQLISATISDGIVALMIIFAMSFGVIIPKMLIDFVSDRWARSGRVDEFDQA
jgi:hypothetical protein